VPYHFYRCYHPFKKVVALHEKIMIHSLKSLFEEKSQRVQLNQRVKVNRDGLTQSEVFLKHIHP